jgi:peptidyl-tRNA hydrolase, PTH1 family
MSDDRWLIAGLGNPGAEYAGNRHNCGFMVADVLAERIGARFKRDRSRAVVVTGPLASRPAADVHEPVRRPGGGAARLLSNPG